MYIRFPAFQVLHDRAQPPGFDIPVQRGQNVGAHLAGVVRRDGAAAHVPARRGGSRGPGPAVRGVRGAVAVPRGPANVHRRPGRRPVRVAVHHHIADPPQDIVVPHRAPQAPGRALQGDQLQTRLANSVTGNHGRPLGRWPTDTYGVRRLSAPYSGPDSSSGKRVTDNSELEKKKKTKSHLCYSISIIEKNVCRHLKIDRQRNISSLPKMSSF